MKSIKKLIKLICWAAIILVELLIILRKTDVDIINSKSGIVFVILILILVVLNLILRGIFRLCLSIWKSINISRLSKKVAKKYIKVNKAVETERNKKMLEAAMQEYKLTKENINSKYKESLPEEIKSRTKSLKYAVKSMGYRKAMKTYKNKSFEAYKDN